VSRLLDISPVVSVRLAVWPGDVPYRREATRTLEGAQVVEESSVAATLTSVRTPTRLRTSWPGPLDRPDPPGDLRRAVPGRGGARLPRREGPADDLLAPVASPRVLVRTGTYPDPERFTPDFAGLSVELAEHLAARGVVLVGIDTPSVDPFSDGPSPPTGARRARPRLARGAQAGRAAPASTPSRPSRSASRGRTPRRAGRALGRPGLISPRRQAGRARSVRPRATSPPR